MITSGECRKIEFYTNECRQLSLNSHPSAACMEASPAFSYLREESRTGSAQHPIASIQDSLQDRLGLADSPRTESKSLDRNTGATLGIVVGSMNDFFME
jgi:hypothetical protein